MTEKKIKRRGKIKPRLVQPTNNKGAINSPFRPYHRVA